MSIPDTVVGHDIIKGDARFLSSLKYRGQLYSIVYGQATPPTIGQKTAALTADIDIQDKMEDILQTLYMDFDNIYAYTQSEQIENFYKVLFGILDEIITQ